MMKLLHTKYRGMTLIEVLLAGTLSALILMSLAAATGNVFDIYKQGKTELSLNRDLAYSLDGILRSIRRSNSATAISTHSILLEDPSGQQHTYSWSGTVGDPLTLKADSGPVLPYMGGVKEFSYSLNNVETVVEETTIVSQELFRFDHYKGAEYWDWGYLGSQDLYGIEFSVPSDTTVDRIELTTIYLRMGKYDSGDTGDLKIALLDTHTMDRAGPFGGIIAEKIFANSSLPWLWWDGAAWNADFIGFSLAPEFTVFPNHRYCLLFRTVGPGDAGYLRFRRLVNPKSASAADLYNGIRAYVTRDLGSTWGTQLVDNGSDLYALNSQDIPSILYGDMISINKKTVKKVGSIDFTITLEKDGEELSFTGREHLQDGIEKL